MDNITFPPQAEDSTKPTSIRMKPEDKAQLQFIQEQLTQPGLSISRNDAILRALHFYAAYLRGQKNERRRATNRRN